MKSNLSHSTRRAAWTLALFATVVAGCARGDHGSGAPLSGAADITAAAPTPGSNPPLGDAELAAAFAKASPKLSEKDAKALIDATLNPVATTARLKMLNDFVVKIAEDSDTRSYLAGAMEGIIWATPRDLASVPAGFGGQTFTTLVEVDSGIAGPTRLQVHGIAATDYTLELVISGFTLPSVHVPKGSNETATAKLVAKALQDANDAIMKTIGDEKTFAPFGGDHSDSPSGVDDIEISTSKGALVILVAQNG